MASAGFVIDLAERTLNAIASQVVIEFANDDTALRVIRIRPNLNDPVCDASQEEVSTLTSNIGARGHKPAGEFPLYRNVVLVNPFGNFVIRRISSRRE